jgi:hypothetical protein
MNQIWRTEPNGDLSAVVLDLRLVIHQGGKFPRFLLLQGSHDRGLNSEVLLESGCEDNVRAVKARAVERAIRRAAAQGSLRSGQQTTSMMYPRACDMPDGTCQRL